ncbi:MAG: BamA/TamA family outer membrane protein, partial [Myxococcota bacterium]
TVFAEARLILGRLDRDNYLFQGVQMTNRLKRASTFIGSELDMNFIHSETLAYLRLPWQSNLAARLTVGHNNTDADQHLFFIGGLDYMRGYFDGQLRGHNFWQTNVEYRIPSIDTSWVVLQHVAFTDVGDVSERFGALTTFERAPRTSIGTGLRLMSPRIYRLTVRLDYAVTLDTQTPQALSFGAAQFF